MYIPLSLSVNTGQVEFEENFATVTRFRAQASTGAPTVHASNHLPLAVCSAK
jgi:hypothetical protein